MQFYLGTHIPSWLATANVPLFVSRRCLYKRKSLPRALTGWALDSGGFSELSMYGEWQTTPQQYVQEVRRYSQEIGNLEWAAAQDYMCEPHIIKNTGLSVLEHQQRTVDNYVQLRCLAPDLPFVPVLQGWHVADYLRHVDMYGQRGVDLYRLSLVGLGSVCRRQNTEVLVDIVMALQPIALHGFGVKSQGLEKIAAWIKRADSMAWSFTARHDKPLAGCLHRNCANCLRYALMWRGRLLEAVERGSKRMVQGRLWAA